jgi:queuine tRNA-ribosyltransferase
MGRPLTNKKGAAPEIRVTPPQNISYEGFSFEISHKDSQSRARVGQLTTPHGTIETPNYIFCGTKASIKNLSAEAMRQAQTDIILANTYHLMIQPGSELVASMGGLHKFMNWHGPMMTDSGGFQIFSMGHGSVADEIKGRNKNNEKSLLKITEEGAKFKSYRDGRTMMLTPEESITIQHQLGADLIYQLDECTAYHDDRDYTARSMERSHRWGDRCLVRFEELNKGTQALYGIVQGGVYEDLRDISCQYVNDRAFFGMAVGGCLGGTEEEMHQVVHWSMDRLRDDRPVHLLGIGRFCDVFRFVREGIDTFDCVSPTRIARHGMALIKGHKGERINLKNARYRDDNTPLDPTLGIPASTEYSKAYIHHLLKSGEMLGMQLIAQHNVAIINSLMRDVRTGIRENCLDEIERLWLG